MNTLLYFAYGSNMLSKRLTERVGYVHRIGVYTLLNHRLLFNSGSFRLNSYANIEPAEGESVEGVLYNLNETQIHSLDFCEGYPRNYEKFYKIETINGSQLVIFGYWTRSEFYKTINGKPNLNYLNIILMGAMQNGLDVTFNKLSQYKNDNYKLTKPSKRFNKKV